MDLSLKYETQFRELVKKGKGRKITLMLWLIPAALFLHHKIEVSYHARNAFSGFSPEDLILLSIGMYVFMNILVLMIHSTSFVSTRTWNRYKREFKADFFAQVSKNCPELKSSKYLGKIHPSKFKESGLFSPEFSDYNGDDWFYGCYKETRFELCELEVINSWFRNIFSGIFIHCILPQDPHNDLKGPLSGKEAVEFVSKYHARIKMSGIGKSLYIALEMDGDFFENSRLRFIRRISRDAILLEDIVRLIKSIIDLNLNPTTKASFNHTENE
jgi:hypothetical protein